MSRTVRIRRQDGTMRVVTYSRSGQVKTDQPACERCQGTGVAIVPCRHCGRPIVTDGEGRWIDPEATGDDSVWRETCDAHDTFVADHEPPRASIVCECGAPWCTSDHAAEHAAWRGDTLHDQ